MRLAIIALLSIAVGAAPALAGFEEAQIYMKNKKYGEAIKELTALIESSGEWPDGHYLLGDCYLYTGKVDDAITEYEKAIELNGDRFDYRAHLAQAYFAGKKNYTKTIEVLNEAEETAVGPQQKAYINKYRGLSYAYVKNPSAAVANLKAANPGQDPLVGKWLGTSCFQIGDYACAIEHLDKATRAEPANFDLVYYLARAHLISGLRSTSESSKKSHYAKAVDAARKATALDSGSIEAQATLAKAQIGAGSFGEAESVFRSLIQRQPKECTHYLDLLTALREQKKWEDIIEAGGKITGSGGPSCDQKEQSTVWTQVGFAWLKRDDKSLPDATRTSYLTKSADASKKALALGAGSFAETNRKTAEENLSRHRDTMASYQAREEQIAAQLAECEKLLDFQDKKAAYLKETAQSDADGDGVADMNDGCAETPTRTLVDDKTGCVTDDLKTCNDLLRGSG